MRTTLKVLGLILGVGAAGCGNAEPVDTEPVESLESPISFTGAVYYDEGNQCLVGGTWMHCCKPGWVMIGARLDIDRFKCAQLSGQYSRAPVLDRWTQRNNMHACPFRSVMAGFNESLNELACVSGTGVQWEFIDGNPPTQDSLRTHVCGASDNFAMSGIHVDENRFTCAF